MRHIISSEVIVAYTQCKRKAFFLFNGKQDGKPSEYISILEQQNQEFRNEYINKIKTTNLNTVEYSISALSKNNILTNAILEWEDLRAYADLLTPKENIQSKKKYYFEPTIIVGNYTITKEQILQLSFSGYVLSKIQGQMPILGNIISGDNKSHKIKFEGVSKTIDPILTELRKWNNFPPHQPPTVLLNKHCPYCPFKEECYVKAKEIDHLSLLQGISRKEIESQNKKGVFTVTQYSYTYRPRRKRKDTKGKEIIKYHYSLKALAIRNNQIYIVNKPQLSLSKTIILLDVEGVPDQGFYYLIGVVVVEDSLIQQFSLWADNQSQEEVIWKQFLEIIKRYESFTLLHYGSYETEFLERMQKRYSSNDEQVLVKIKPSCINVLSLIYANIYFPTYSNGLKDIGAYLGARWSAEEASGLQSLVWRYKWELTRNAIFKQKLIEYNIEDCSAIKPITQVIIHISDSDQATGSIFNTVVVDDMEKESEHLKYGKNTFALEELKFINKHAYFDYQREKVYFRKTKKKSHINPKKPTRRFKTYRINKVITIPTPQKCTGCDNIFLSSYGMNSKISFDLKFFNCGVKRWVVKYSTVRVYCKSCDITFLSERYLDIQKHGLQLKLWIVYQIIALRQSHLKVKENLRSLFNYNIGAIHNAKHEMAIYYNETYMGILSKLKKGQLIQADETTVNIKGINAYVWVFTSLEEVFYVYSPTREGEILKEILKAFDGVLVSDYYSAYDSLECPQQKCLIHLVRDINDDLLKNPFDEQYKTFVKDFSVLLKSIVGTIDKYGLKKYHLGKHKKDVENFFDKYLFKEFESEVLVAYQKRFNYNRTKLFTFLDYDGIPWNNNNAETAIKGFAVYRKNVDAGFNEKGIKEFLTLLSIYKTCEYKNIDFLKFLRSGEKDIDRFHTG